LCSLAGGAVGGGAAKGADAQGAGAGGAGGVGDVLSGLLGNLKRDEATLEARQGKGKGGGK